MAMTRSMSASVGPKVAWVRKRAACSRVAGFSIATGAAPPCPAFVPVPAPPVPPAALPVLPPAAPLSPLEPPVLPLEPPVLPPEPPVLRAPEPPALAPAPLSVPTLPEPALAEFSVDDYNRVASAAATAQEQGRAQQEAGQRGPRAGAGDGRDCS